MRTAALITALSLLTVACVPDASSDAPAADADATARTLSEGSDEATIVLYLANHLDQDALDDDVTLDSRAAANIVAHRAGTDGVEGTSDDDVIDSLAELDGISYVGSSAMGELLDFGLARGMTGEDVHGVLVGTIEAEAILFVANQLSETALDYDVALDSRAASNITSDRGSAGLTRLADLDDVSYVSGRAFGKLLDFAHDHGMLDDEGLAVRGGTAYDTLQDAVDASSTHITIHLFAGTYAGTTTIDSTLIVRGYDRDRTVLDGEGTDLVLDVNDGSPCFYDLTVRDGAASWGAGADVTTYGSVLFDNVAFAANVSTYSGGAVYGGSYADLTLVDVSFEGNESGSLGGGLYSAGSVALDGVSFEHNLAYGGAAAYVFDSVELDSVSVRLNEGESSTYGALTLRGDVDAVDVDFYDNEFNDLALDYGEVYDGLGSDVSFSCDSTGCSGLE